MWREWYTLIALTVALATAPVTSAVSAAREALNPGPHATETPSWFKETFLDIREDVREAAAEGKRLLVYFGQDGCPYCRELMRVNFAQKEIADLTRRRFNAVAINMWGDREVTWTDGKVRSEKDFAALMKVQFTPTLLFFDEKGAVVLRLNGYYPPHRFRAALDYVSGKHESRIAFASYLERHGREPASGRLHGQPYFMKQPYRLAASQRPEGKPLLVLFEQKQCAACDRLHERGMRDAAVQRLIGKFDVARLELFGAAPVETPEGRTLTESQWGRALGVAYTPSLVFFDTAGKEVFRMEASFQPFHLASGLEYVASGAYLKQPSFQRYVQQRAERIRSTGGRVDLW
ncbi:MAG TPA: thioredoxin fold domain-containing protein [Burkholderiales bacterium]|jgi:thioredoxin-related protein|nr:thioredoxin fold domain-containing protein [Burkholderiales bacterium]